MIFHSHKKFLFYSIISLNLFLFCDTQASQDQIFSGSQNADKIVCLNLKVGGSSTLKSLIAANVSIRGSLNVQEALTCWALTVGGSCDLNTVKAISIASGGSFTAKKVEVTEKVDVGGSLEADSLEAKQLDVGGSCHAQNISVKENFKVHGSVTLDTLKADEIKINGSCKVNKNFEALSAIINGSAELNQATLMNFLNVKGNLTACKSSINKLTAAGDEIYLSDCTLDSITIQKSSEKLKIFSFGFRETIKPFIIFMLNMILRIFKKGPFIQKNDSQKVFLKQQTVVKGDIIFEKEGEQVHKEKNAKIVGKVVNGTIIDI